MNGCCHRKGIVLLALLWILAFMSIACANDGKWRLDAEDGAQLPRNFRFATDPWHNAVQGDEPTRRGLDTLRVSASAQPALRELPALYNKLKETAPDATKIYMVDLRQESHGFADQWPVSWHKKHNIANQGMDAAAVEKDEAERLRALPGHMTTFRPLGNSDKARFKERTFAPKTVQTEREAAEKAGFRYVRFAATDQVWPEEHAVESFLAFVAALPEDAWLHFHCHAGHGRTTTFLSIYDILKNPDVSLEEVVKRHYLQGGTNLLAENTGDSWNDTQKRRRAKMMRLFYRYANELRTKDTSLSWSEWLKKETSKAEVQEKQAFPATPTGAFDETAMGQAAWKMPPSFTSPFMETGARADSVEILGPAEVPQRQMVLFLERRNPKAKLNCTPTELVSYYYEEAGREGVRPDIALCQAFKETGFFNYGGDVLPEQNNFCGLGALGNKVRGAKFESPRLGARAHIQHLLAYTSLQRPSTPIVDPRYEHIAANRKDIYGQIHTWTGLNGNWAVPGTHYGQDILRLWGEAKAPDGSPESLIQATMSIRKNPESAVAYLARGIAYANGGQPENALLDYGESLRLAPSAEAYFDRALCHEHLGDTRAALADYTDAIRLEPDFPQCWYNRGLLSLRLGRNGDAIRDFEQSLVLVPQLADACVGLGIAYARQKDYARAWQEFHRAGLINTENETVKANQKIIRSCLIPGTTEG